MNPTFLERLLHYLGIRPSMAIVLASFNQVSSDLDAVVLHQNARKAKSEAKIAKANAQIALATATATRAATVSTNMKALLGE